VEKQPHDDKKGTGKEAFMCLSVMMIGRDTNDIDG
jgi:hypothetical protein